MAPEIKRPAEVAARLRSLPAVRAVAAAAGAQPAYLVGGVIRDTLLGEASPDLDVVVEGDAMAVASRLGDTTHHERFGTAKVHLKGAEVDLVTARRESYPRPGALPEVEPGDLGSDLARRDFTINAMALPLEGPEDLIDPHGGLDDLRRGLVRVLHERSFVDDPTRALRAARYASRFGFGLEPRTAELIGATDLGTVSEDRVRSDLARLADERDPAAGARLLVEWGLLRVEGRSLELIGPAMEVLSRPDWAEAGTRREVLLALLRGVPERSERIAAAAPEAPSQAVAVAGGASPVELVVARALGAGWLDEYLRRWRYVTLEIGGDDLIEAGVEPGPAMGRALEAALRAKLDGEAEGREQELALALAAARRAGA